MTHAGCGDDTRGLRSFRRKPFGVKLMNYPNGSNDSPAPSSHSGDLLAGIESRYCSLMARPWIPAYNLPE